MTSEQMLFVAVSGCVTAIVHLYIRQERKHAAAADRLDKCEQDRIELWKRIADLSLELGCGCDQNKRQK